MKQSHFLPLIVLSLVLSACSTYQYTARQTEVRQRPIDAKEQLNSITVNYDKQVTATSDYQMTKKDAIAEAEFRCIEDEKIDVVVDPIFKVEYNPFKFKRRFKATIVGFAGKYKEEPNRLDDSKKYTLEEIEKFKLLYDANFPQYYYQKSNEGDRYFFNSGAPKLSGDLSFNSGTKVLGNSNEFLRAQKQEEVSKPTNIFQGYIELSGFFKGGDFPAGGIEFINSYGCRFNEYAYLGGGFGLSLGFTETWRDLGGSFNIPLFVDARGYCPTPKKGLYPFLGVTIGPQFQCFTFGGNYSDFQALAYFRLYAGLDYKRFTFSIGYHLIGNGDGHDNYGFVKLGVRLGKKKMY